MKSIPSLHVDKKVLVRPRQLWDAAHRDVLLDRLRREGIDVKLVGIGRFTTVADVIDHFLSEGEKSRLDLSSVHVA